MPRGPVDELLAIDDHVTLETVPLKSLRQPAGLSRKAPGIFERAAGVYAAAGLARQSPCHDNQGGGGRPRLGSSAKRGIRVQSYIQIRRASRTRWISRTSPAGAPHPPEQPHCPGAPLPARRFRHT